MSEVPPGCGPHRKAASLQLSPIPITEQMFDTVKNRGSASGQFLKGKAGGGLLLRSQFQLHRTVA